MIIGNKREEVIENICRATQAGTLNCKVETDDPQLDSAQTRAIIDGYLQKRATLSFHMKSFAARRIANAASAAVNRDTEIRGTEHLRTIRGGAIITSNHFSPFDNTVIRHMVRQQGKKRVNIVSNVSNLAMPGTIGFLMNYADVIPICSDRHYLSRDFYRILRDLIDQEEYVLIYPEQEMWFNYRKPRPLMRGAYYYAAKLGVPVISCFVEQQNTEQEDNDAFWRVKYILHILPTLYPDPQKTPRENSILMCEQDYQQKKQAYEEAYCKPLDYTFSPNDIAGWKKV